MSAYKPLQVQAASTGQGDGVGTCMMGRIVPPPMNCELLSPLLVLKVSVSLTILPLLTWALDVSHCCGVTPTGPGR